MRNIVYSVQFRRDAKLVEKRGRDLRKLAEVLSLLVDGTPLPPRLRDHALSGKWKNLRDCHIEPDWVLLYKIEGADLQLVRTGSYSDLF